MKTVVKKLSGLALLSAVVALSACSTAQIKEVDKETFYLTEFYSEPVTGFDSWSLRRQAKEVCPTGYRYLLRTAGKPSEFAKQHFECVGGQDCTYALEWRIKCTDQPQEKFSIFGKS
jgi:hypothetical protein